MINGIIYLYTNNINGKVYIGQTINEVKRKNEHKRASILRTPYFHKAIQKYGWNNFSYDVIYRYSSNNTDDVKEKLNFWEVFYIKEYDSTNPDKGYNLAEGGGGVAGFTYTKTEEHKKKISESNKGKHNHYGENNPNCGNHKFSGENGAWFGRHHTEESKNKMKKSWEKRRLTPISDETREKMKESHKKEKKYKWLTPSGEIREMCERCVKQYHQDWKKVA